nr:ribonuclease H-like domain-containing protein [Tanacetum cinerariifolium]
MESLNPQVVAAAKLHILNPNEFDLWKMRIKQYFLMTDYSLWKVILNGDSPPPTKIVDGVIQVVAPTTAEQRLAKKNELKAKETLLMALHDKHQLKFNIHKDAKSLMEAIKKRFDEQGVTSLSDPRELDEPDEVYAIKLHNHEFDNRVPKNPENDRYKTGKGYHVVPPLYIGTFMPPRHDLVFTDDPTASESVANVFNVESSPHKPSNDMSKTYRPDAPIVEDWISDFEDETKIESVPKQREPSFVKSTEHVKTSREFVKKVEHNKQAENLRTNNQKSRGNNKNWNNKTCFVCGSLNHLIKDCDYYEKQMVQKLVWNNTMRVSHQNSVRMTHPHSNRNVVPTIVLTRSRLVSLNAVRHVPTAVTQSPVKSTWPVKQVVNKSHSPGNKGNPEKASAYWVWKPKCKVLDYVSRLT